MAEISIEFPHDKLIEAWEDERYKEGSTEPWTQYLIASFVKSMGAKNVLETGTFHGFTTAWLASTGAQIVSVDLEDRGGETFVSECGYDNVMFRLGDALEAMRNLPLDSFDIVFIDDDHHWPHVRKEILAAQRIVRPGGLILLHDAIAGAWGHRYPLHEFGGVCVDLPKLHLAGGLGIISV